MATTEPVRMCHHTWVPGDRGRLVDRLDRDALPDWLAGKEFRVQRLPKTRHGSWVICFPKADGAADSTLRNWYIRDALVEVLT